eukprot:10559125-Alexandrium_andersonii.AAC.1
MSNAMQGALEWQGLRTRGGSSMACVGGRQGGGRNDAQRARASNAATQGQAKAAQAPAALS